MMKKLSQLFAVALLAMVFGSATLMAQGVNVGDKAPEFDLKNVNGDMVSFDTYEDAEGYIVVFTCNHCPYSKLYEDRINDLNNQYADQGYPVIAINPNDAEQYPSDSYKNMKKRAKQKDFTFAYLHDESQEIAQAYGASRTPHIFLVKNGEDRTVAYIGAIDDNPKDAELVEQKFLEDAIQDLKAGNSPKVTETKAVGCSIKWKKS